MCFSDTSTVNTRMDLGAWCLMFQKVNDQITFGKADNDLCLAPRDYLLTIIGVMFWINIA
jgi:hypothetical protein